MEILLWLVPPVLVTLVAMAWVGWVGREGRGEVDREEAVRRLGAALDRAPGSGRRRVVVGPVRARRRHERSTGVALRRTPAQAASQPPVQPPAEGGAETPAGEQRRAS